MTDKLTIQHLAPYLAYGLIVKDIHSGKEGQIVSIYDIEEYEDIKIKIGHYDGEHIWMFKPLLRPLSQLTQTIVHGGREFVPILELAKIFSGADSISYYKGHVSNYYYFRCEWNGIAGYEDLIISDKLEPWYKSYFEKNNSQYLGNNVINLWNGWQKLISWHFNVFNLPPELFIEKPAK